MENHTRPTKVMQTVTEGAGSNCVQAAVASWWGIPLEEVPVMEDRTWFEVLRMWSEQRGYGFITVAVASDQVFQDGFSKGYVIVSGKSPRGRLHSVVYHNGRLWHDPHPEGGGIEAVEFVDFFYPLVPPPYDTTMEIARLTKALNYAELGLSCINTETAAYYEGQDAAVAGVARRWRQALNAPIPAPGVMQEPLESLYRETEALRLALQMKSDP